MLELFSVHNYAYMRALQERGLVIIVKVQADGKVIWEATEKWYLQDVENPVYDRMV